MSKQDEIREALGLTIDEYAALMSDGLAFITRTDKK